MAAENSALVMKRVESESIALQKQQTVTELVAPKKNIEKCVFPIWGDASHQARDVCCLCCFLVLEGHEGRWTS